MRKRFHSSSKDGFHLKPGEISTSGNGLHPNIGDLLCSNFGEGFFSVSAERVLQIFRNHTNSRMKLRSNSLEELHKRPKGTGEGGFGSVQEVGIQAPRRTSATKSACSYG